MTMPASPLHTFSIGCPPMSYSSESDVFDFNPAQSTTVALSGAMVAEAIHLCQQEPEATQQWPTFLRAMGLQGLKQWLEAGALPGEMTWDRHRPPSPGVNGWVNHFRLCLVTQGSIGGEVVSVPRSTVEDDHGFAHLYVLAEVQEEANQVTILGALRRDRLLTLQAQGALATDDQGYYALPVAHFDTSPEDLLLYIHCLNPAQLTPSLALTPPPAVTPMVWNLAPLAGGKETLINVGDWLQDQLDTVATALAWQLLPPRTAAYGLRSKGAAMEAMESVLQELELEGVSIPSTARGAYTDLQPLGLPCRLYALIWTMVQAHSPEWSLFLCLGPVPGEELTRGTRLIVRDDSSTLVEQALGQDSDTTYLYTQVIGTWEEQFRVTVALPNGNTLHWPPFVFRPQGA